MKPPRPLKVAIGRDGPLGFTPDQIDLVIKDIMATGELLFLGFRKGNDLGMVVLGEPSPDIPELLETIAASYRVGLKTGRQEGS